MKPLKPSDSAPPKHYSMDIEDGGNGPDSFLVGCTMSETGFEKTYYDIDDLTEWLVSPKGSKNMDVWVYNASYELAHIFGNEPAFKVKQEYGLHDFQFINNRASLLGCIIKHGPGEGITRVKDLSRFLPGGLDKVGTLVGVSKTGCKCDSSLRAKKEGVSKLNIEGSCTWCGQYNVRAHKGKSRLSDLNQFQRARMIEYCMRDCLVTIRGAMQEYADCQNERIKPRAFSIGSKALASFRTNDFTGQGYNERDRMFSMLEQLSVYGGRTEICDSRLYEQIYYADYNSAYPFAMLNRHPNPETASVVMYPWERIKDLPGMSLARITIPEHFRSGLLPVRLADGIFYPVGKFYGIWPHCELQEAELHGAKIESIQSITYEWMESMFKPFILRNYKARLKKAADGDEIGKEQKKLLMNNLFGKTAQRPGGIQELPVNRICMQEECRCQLRHVKIDDLTIFHGKDGDWVRFHEATSKEPPHRRPILAAYITGYQRARMMPHFLDSRVIGGDTDSIFLTGNDYPPLKDSGDELGKFKVETRENFQAIAPKQYSYTIYRCYHCRASGFTQSFRCKKHPDIEPIKIQDHKAKGINKSFNICFRCISCGNEYDASMPKETCDCGHVLGIYGKGERPIKREESRARKLTAGSWVEHEKFASGNYTRKIRMSNLLLKPHVITDERTITSFNHFLKIAKLSRDGNHHIYEMKYGDDEDDLSVRTASNGYVS